MSLIQKRLDFFRGESRLAGRLFRNTDNARSVYERLSGPKKLVWAEGGQTDFYDQPVQVALAIDAADAFLKGAA